MRQLEGETILCLSFTVVPHFLDQTKSKVKNAISSALIIVTVIEISVAIGRSFFTDFSFFLPQKSPFLTGKLIMSDPNIPLQSAVMDIYPLEMIRELYHRKYQNKVCRMVWILAASLRCLWQSVAVKVMKVAFTAYSAGAITNGESAPILCSDFVIRSTAAARCRRRQQHNPASTLTSASEQVKGASEEATPRTGHPAWTEGMCR